MNWDDFHRRVERFIAPVYKLLFVIYVLTAFFTFVISYAQSMGSEYLASFVKVIPIDIQVFMYEHRYQTALFLLLILILYWKRRKNNFEEACNRIDSFQRELGGTIANIIKNYNGVTENDKGCEKYDELSRDIFDFLNKFTTHVGKILSSHTGSLCHVSIKTLNGETVTSWVREKNMSDSSRATIDEDMYSYPYSVNTAFSEIIDNPKEIFYINNWLKLSGILGKYKNANPMWKKCYSATLVVPITLKTHPNQVNKDNIWGFICVDNKRGGFDDSSAWLLYSFARICANVFECIPLINKISCK